ncbi:transposase [Aliarcobacter butzleri]|uniref:transposase n=1 Tax=Aliarcobacter butzleri TaxID=28197 RepID=UPI003AF553D9
MNIVKMSDMEAFRMFKTIRWNETNGDVVCSCYVSVKKPYFLKTRMQCRCKKCFYTFSVTSGNIFANHKLALQTYLLAIVLFTNSVKSISALQLSSDLNVQYKTAWFLSHKIRESLEDSTLSITKPRMETRVNFAISFQSNNTYTTDKI